MERYYINTARVDKIIKIMSEEEKKAESILSELREKIDSEWQCIKVLNILDDMNIRGIQIVIAFDEYAGGDIQKFMESICQREQNMVGYVNSKLPEYPKEFQAVKEGASRIGKISLQPNPDKLIRIIDTENRLIYELKEGSTINVVSEDKVRTSACHYLDDYYMMLDEYIVHIQEFAQIVAINQYKVLLTDKKVKTSDRILNRNERAYRKKVANGNIGK